MFCFDYFLSNPIRSNKRNLGQLLKYIRYNKKTILSSKLDLSMRNGFSTSMAFALLFSNVLSSRVPHLVVRILWQSGKTKFLHLEEPWHMQLLETTDPNKFLPYMGQASQINNKL